jgi:hypothetical protein
MIQIARLISQQKTPFRWSRSSERTVRLPVKKTKKVRCDEPESQPCAAFKTSGIFWSDCGPQTVALRRRFGQDLTPWKFPNRRF